MRRFSNISTTQIARICGVSQGTVDRALHNRPGVNPETRERILAVAREYGYAPGISEKARFGEHSMLIGAVLYDLYNEYFSKLAMSLTEVARQAGYSIIFLFSEKKIEEEKAAVDYFHFIGVDGILLFSVGSDDSEYLSYLKSIKRPLVTIGNRLNGIAHVGIDDEAAMYDLTQEIARTAEEGELQYFSPVVAKALNKDNAQLLRLRGFMRAAEELGRDYKIVTDEEELSPKTGGIICSTDHYLLRAVGALGRDIEAKLAGFDNTSVPKRLNIRAASVEYSTDEIAEETIKYLLGRPYNARISHRIVYNDD
ncbi:MAG: LacI family DNA-binding transcriptional regulator [Clostridia bacterium]|nr:LacI family DNA-binding transcriptional regulator [Clostridia bacterium]